MKMIYIANVRIPSERANAIQIMKMCEAFASQNIEVELVVPIRFKTTKVDPYNYYKVKPIFKIKKILSFDLIIWDKYLGRFAFWIQSFSFLFFCKLYLLFRKFDIIYTRDLYTGLFFKNYCLEIHSVPNIILKFHQKIWEKAKALVVITSLIKEKLLENNIKLKNIIIAPDGVDLQDFSISISKEDARKKLALPLNKMIVLYSGSFLVYKWKGVETMLAAARQCLRDDIVFVLVGGKEEEIDRLNKKFGTLSNVLLISKKSYSEIPLYLKSADILVLPNEKDEPASSLYTSPLKLFEYMASDRPIVASDLPSIRDVLNSTRCVFFLPGNPRDLVDKVLLLLGDKDLQSRISTEITHAIKRYSWDIRARNILSVCNIIN